MPYYSDEIIEEVRSRTDIVDVISRYVNLQKKGSQYFGLCPFHNEKTGSFSVSPQKQMYYCFGCGAGGNVFSFLMAYENMTFKEAVEELAPKCGVTLPQREMTYQEKQRADKLTKKLQPIITKCFAHLKDSKRLAILQSESLLQKPFTNLGLVAPANIPIPCTNILEARAMRITSLRTAVL